MIQTKLILEIEMSKLVTYLLLYGTNIHTHTLPNDHVQSIIS